MKASNYIKIEFPSHSSNEGFARAAVSAFASQLDPTLEELGDSASRRRIPWRSRCGTGAAASRTWKKP